MEVLKKAGWRDEAKASGGMRDLIAYFGPSVNRGRYAGLFNGQC